MIETARLRLRAFKESEADSLSALFGNWDVSKWFWTPPYPYTEDVAGSYIQEVASAHLAKRFNHFAIALKDSDMLIGGISLDIDPAPEWENEVSYWVGEPYWRHGYASEALSAIRDFAKTDQGRPYLWAVPDKNNLATIRVLEKCGFTHREDIQREQPSRTESLAMSRYQIDFI